MAGRWMTAGNRTALYRADVPVRGDGVVTNYVARGVLRELCAVAHDAGIAHVLSAVLAERLGVSDRHVRRALARLERDGWITRPVRGGGNRMNKDQPRASVYVLRPLPDADGHLWPDPEWVGHQWPAYAQTPRFLHLSRGNRAAVRMAAQAALHRLPEETPAAPGTVDNRPGEESNNRTALAQQPDSPVRPITRKQELQAPAVRQHPRAARRRAGRLTVIRQHPEAPPPAP